MNALLTRARETDLRRVDAIFAAALALDLVLEASLAHGVPDSVRLATALFAVPLAATVALRRWRPAAALLACTALALLQGLLHGQLFGNLPSESAELVPILCGYGVGAWLELRRAISALAAAAVLLYALALVQSYVTHSAGWGGWSGDLSIVLFFLIAPWLVGRLVQSRTRRAQAFAALEAQAVGERAAREHAAIAEERVVIGRELQDIIAHSVSVMVVQAGGARRLLRREPDRARDSMLVVEQIGREALAEMRRLLGLLRKDDDPRALAPQPGLDQLPELAESIRGRGLECELHCEGKPIDLTPGIDLVGYRAIEAVLRDAAASGCVHASAIVRYAPHELELEIHGEKSLPTLPDAIRAVSERIGLYGGKLELLHASDGEFTARCRLPLEGSFAV